MAHKASNLPEKVLRTLAYELPKRFALPDDHFEWSWRLRRHLPEIVRKSGAQAALFCCGPHGQLTVLPKLRRAHPNLRILVDYRDLLGGNTWNEPTRAGVRRRLRARERHLLSLAEALFVNSGQARERFAQALGEIPGLAVEVMRNAADYELAWYENEKFKYKRQISRRSLEKSKFLRISLFQF